MMFFSPLLPTYGAMKGRFKGMSKLGETYLEFEFGQVPEMGDVEAMTDVGDRTSTTR